MNTSTKPASKWKTWHKVVIGICVAFLGLMFIAVNSDDKKKAGDYTAAAADIKNETGADVVILADIPLMITDTIEAIEKKFGNGSDQSLATDLQKSMDITSEKTFAIENYTVDVSYGTNKFPTEFLIYDTVGKISDVKEVYKKFNLKDGEGDYTVKQMPILSHPADIASLKVIVK